MHFTFTLALLAAVGLAAQDDFANYSARYGKSYPSVDEYNKRMGNWEKNHVVVESLNHINKLNGNIVWFTDNFTSDMDDDEFQKMLGLQEPPVGSQRRLLEATEDERRHL